MTAVSNTSPLILLDKIDHLFLLERLFQKVIISPAVDKEWLRPGGYSVPSWLSVEPLSPVAQKIADDLRTKIDPGEAEAIALCAVMKLRWVILDDMKGRYHARSIDLQVIGTLGILTAAKKKGMIPALKPLLEQLKTHRFYVADDVLAAALALVGEQ
jgi:predicted nucleic acid-binding protein